MRARSRKSSARVTLVLLGAAALAGCGDGAQISSRRDVYASKADCLADWGDPKECDEGQVQGSGASGLGGSRRYWYGPSYGGGTTWGGYQPGPPRPGSRALGTQSTVRGGFGASGHAHSASSSS